MKFVITGASGFIGKELVAIFQARNADLLLVGRDATRLSELFPGAAVCGYDEIGERARGFDMLVHCAVANSDSDLSEQAVWQANVALLASVMASVEFAGIQRFVHLSSFHALDEVKDSAYARSKRASIDIVEQSAIAHKTVIYMPLVYGDRWSGKLSRLNGLPRPLAMGLFRLLAALKPTLRLSTLAETIWWLGSASVSPPDMRLADDVDANPWYWLGKKILDFGFALAVILLFGWAMLLVWIAVKLHSPGPGIFAQERVGRHGKVFTCYKFRTMAVGTKNAGTHEVSASTVTRLGAFLRRTKLDELPQVWNILRNEMSLVGPRPCLPSQTEMVKARENWGVFKLLPGITGLAQIKNIDMSTPGKLARMDAEYGVTRSLIMDLKIILQTFIGKGQGDKIRKG